MEQTRVLLIGIIVTAIIGIAIALTAQWMLSLDRLNAASASTTRTALRITERSITLTAAEIPEINIEATPVQNDAQTLLDEARAWSLVAYDAFDDVSYDWSLGDDGDRSTGQRTIEEGKYVWDVAAIDDFTWTSAPHTSISEDFYVAVEMEKFNADTGSTNIIFRYADFDNYYDFGLCVDNVSYQLWRKFEGSWTELIPCTKHEALSAETNHLAVIGQANTYTFLANNQPLTTLADTFNPSGSFGVSIDLDTGHSNIFRFDNFELRTPNGD